jgi:hypothetical protein
MNGEDELLSLLDEAVTIVSKRGAMDVYCGFDTGAEFAAELRSLRERIAHRDWTALERAIGIFAPTGAWDDGVGASGMNLANRVMAVLDELDWRSPTRRGT